MSSTDSSESLIMSFDSESDISELSISMIYSTNIQPTSVIFSTQRFNSRAVCFLRITSHRSNFPARLFRQELSICQI
uniref:Uncharacterized protein n=1 Tax=Anguilla anguilla TaxID=7936 RepID=A0A0E9QY15_ANGAN